MAEPHGVFALNQTIFDNSISTSDNIILSQGRWALFALINSIDALYKLLSADRLVRNLYLSPEIQPQLHVIAHRHGSASSLLLNTTPRGPKETKSTYDARRRRYEYIQKRIGGQAFPTLQDRKLRNVLTHMEEYLSKELQRPNTSWMIDMTILSEDSFQAEEGVMIEFCSTYVARTNSIRHLGYTISLDGLRSEASLMLNMVWGNPITVPLPRPTIRYSHLEQMWIKDHDNLPPPL